ncbi:hypothetical protein HAX54_005524, partial [Datura stramonium]|nr:hypothetical protein [Datura stramonium]
MPARANIGFRPCLDPRHIGSSQRSRYMIHQSIARYKTFYSIVPIIGGSLAVSGQPLVMAFTGAA